MKSKGYEHDKFVAEPIWVLSSSQFHIKIITSSMASRDWI